MAPLWTALAFAAGGWLSIGAVLIALVLLSARRGLLIAAMFVAGYVLGYVIIGALTLLIGRELAGVGAVDTAVGVVLLVFGALFIFFAVRNLHKVLTGGDTEPPRLFTTLDGIRPRKAFFFGALVTFINVKNLAIFAAAVGELSGLALPYRFLALPLVVVVFCAAPAATIAMRLLLRERADTWLQRLKAWLETNGRRVSVVLLMAFGALFIKRGLTTVFG